MNKQNNYSDEYISAFIDGELDSEERASLLFDEQEDEELAQRINQTRMLKEKVQLAYADIKNKKDIKKSFSCSAFVSRHRAVAASLFFITAIAAMFTFNMTNHHDVLLAQQLIKNTQPIAASKISDVIGSNRHVIINVSQYQPQTFSSTISNIETLLQNKSGSGFEIEIVANGQGLKALDTVSSLHAEKISLLAKQFDNLKVVACAKSLAKLAEQGDPIQLMKSIMITPSAAEQVAKRTGAGWLFVKV